MRKKTTQRTTAGKKKKTPTARKTGISGAQRRPRTPSHPRRDNLRVHHLAEQLYAVRAIGEVLASSVGIDALLLQIVPQVSRLMRAERTTLFLVDETTGEIWSKVAEGTGVREIRLNLGEGIAGWVAQRGQSACIENAYSDPRFNPGVDAETGFRTRSVAAAPVLERQGRLIGVLQVLNHVGGPFTDDDLGLLEAIAVQTAYALENAQLAQDLLDQNRELEAARARVERQRSELDLLYQLEQETSRATDLDELLQSAIARTCERLRSEAGSVLLVEQGTGKLLFRGVSGARKDALARVVLEPGEGIVGWVAQHAEPVVVNSPADDPRHGKALAEKINMPAHAILAVPLVWDGKVIGAVEVLNPQPRASGARAFDLEDMKVLTVIAGQMARAVSSTLERQARMDTERLAAVGRMLAGVAHDLRNPMTVISGYAQLMALEAEPTVRQARCEHVLSQVDEMTAMISDLLAFSRGETLLRPMTVDVARLAGEVRDHLGLQCEPRGIVVTVQGEEGQARVDLGRVKRIVYNLAKNAVEVLGRGDTLNVSLLATAGGLRIRVSDSGPGIPPDIRARIFEPFVSRGKAHGTGLGLSIVRRFVDDHGGRIDIDSAIGEGTTFTVELPPAA